MRLAKVIERNRQIKTIAKKATQRVESAVIHSIDGDRVNIRLNNSPTLVRHVEVAGDIGALKPNIVVPIIWKEKRPVVLAGQPLGIAQAGSAGSGFLVDISARVIRTSNQASGDVDAPTAITFDTALYDTAGLWSPDLPTRLTVPESGMYTISGYVLHATGAAAYGRANLQVNETTVLAGIRTYTGQTASPVVESVSYTLRLNAGDFVEFTVGSGRNCLYVEDSSPTLSIARLYE